MSKSKCMVVLGAVAIGIMLTYSVIAQQGATQAKAPAARPVALVDVTHILSQNGAIETQFKALNEKYSKLMRDTAQEGQEVAQLNDLLGTYDKNSDKYRETEQLLLSKTNGISSKQTLLYKEMIEERMRIVNNAYNLIIEQATRVAKHYGMQIVMNYDRVKMLDSAQIMNSQQQYEAFYQQYSMVLATRPIVWADDRTVDITTLVLNEIHKAHPETVQKVDATANAQQANANKQVGSKAQGK